MENITETIKTKQVIIIKAALAILAFIIFLWINPFAFNEGGERTVVTKITGGQYVQFEPGIYYQGLFAKETVWPNRISVSHKDSVAIEKIIDNTMEIGMINVRFNDATTADIGGITQYMLPSTEKEMIEIHNTHRTPEALVKRRLAPYTKECLQSAAQLISSESHYSGGRAQMSQNYIDQLRNGSYLLVMESNNVYDSLEKTSKKVYEVSIKIDKSGQIMRKYSSIKEYGVLVDDAQITDVDYQSQVDDMLKKKIEAATAASISKQRLMTAQQQGLTAAAEGQRKLVETEYAQKQAQTSQTVAAQTKVQLADLYKQEQKAAAEAAVFAAQKIRIDADANAYQNRQLRDAGLTAYEKAQFEKDTKIGVAEAISKINLPTTYIVGGNNGNTSSLIDALLSTKLIEKDK